MNIKLFYKCKFTRLLFSILIMGAFSSAIALGLDKVTAIVNNDVITSSELLLQEKIWLSKTEPAAFRDIPRDILHEKLLEKIILNKIQLQLAMETGIAVDDVTLDKKIYSISKESGLSMEQLKSSVETSQQISFAAFRDQIRQEIAIERLQFREIGQQINISQEEVTDFLNSSIGQIKAGYEYRLAHLLLLVDESKNDSLPIAMKKAESLLERLKNGESFEKIAIENSNGKNALQGGDLGWRKLQEIPCLLTSYVPTMKVSEIVGPLRSSSGLHIIKLVEKRTRLPDEKLETHVKHILMKTNAHFSDDDVRKKLINIRVAALEKNNFHDLARQYSVEAHTAANGGDLGWVKKDSVLPAFAKKMNLLKLGEISQPFKSAIGWHLIQVVDRRSQASSDKMIRNQALDFLFQRKFEKKLMAWLYKLRQQARVDILN